MGMETYLDSNAASYIRSFAFEDTPSDEAVKGVLSMANNIDFKEMKNFNPSLYLFEASHNKSEKSIKKIRETVSAIFAIKMMNKPLSLLWGMEFRNRYELRAKNEADMFLTQFYRELEIGQAAYIDSVTDLLERDCNLICVSAC